MKFGYIFTGLLFLANPNVGIIDVIPDFIGFFLIIKGLHLSPVLIPAMGNAEKNLWKLFVVGVIKTLVSFVLIKDIHTLPLLLAFSFATVELIFLIPAIGALFDGISYSQMRFGGNLEFKKKQRIVRDPVIGEWVPKTVEIDRSARIKLITVIFVLWRTVLSVVPTLTDLQLFDNTGEVVAENVIPLSRFDSLIAFLVCVVCLVGSVVWICFLSAYFRGIKKDSKLKAGISEAFENKVETNPDLPTGIDFKKITVFISGSIIAYNSLVIDGVNFLPNFISAMFAIAAAVSISKYHKKSLIAVPFSIIAGVLSVYELFLQVRYFVISDYVVEDSFWIGGAGSIYAAVRLVSFVENVLIGLCIILLLLALSACRKRQNEKSDKTNKPDVFALELRRSLNRRNVFVILTTALVSIVWALYSSAVLYFPPISVPVMLVTVVWTFFAMFFVLDTYVNTYKVYLV